MYVCQAYATFLSSNTYLSIAHGSSLRNNREFHQLMNTKPSSQYLEVRRSASLDNSDDHDPEYDPDAEDEESDYLE
jgi:hypothetical protein